MTGKDFYLTSIASFAKRTVETRCYEVILSVTTRLLGRCLGLGWNEDKFISNLAGPTEQPFELKRNGLG